MSAPMGDETLAELRSRANTYMTERDEARAALARVTDDSMAETIRDELAHVTIGSGYYQTSVGTDEADEMAGWVLTAIRAAAASPKSTN